MILAHENAHLNLLFNFTCFEHGISGNVLCVFFATCFSLSIFYLGDLSMLIYVDVIHSFLLLYSLSVYDYTLVYLYFH